MIRQLRVRGYKSLQDDTLTMRPLRILIGANAAGKSNVVDALRFLPEAVPSDVATALARRGGLPTVVFLGTPEKRFELGLDYGMPGSDDGETLAEFRYTLVVAEHDGMPGVSMEALKNAPNGRAALNQAWLQSAWGKGSAPKHHDEQHPTTFELDSETTLALRAVGVFDEYPKVRAFKKLVMEGPGSSPVRAPVATCGVSWRLPPPCLQMIREDLFGSFSDGKSGGGTWPGASG